LRQIGLPIAARLTEANIAILEEIVVPSKSRKRTPAEIDALEARRDIGAEILQSINDMKSGKGAAVVSPAAQARSATGLSQSQLSGA
jgi:hypothetical protein